MHQGYPNPQGFHGVCIGVPVDHRYPAASRPPSSAPTGRAAAARPSSSALNGRPTAAARPPSAAMNVRAAPPPSAALNGSAAAATRRVYYLKWFAIGAAIICTAAAVLAVVIVLLNNAHSNFHMEGVSVIAKNSIINDSSYYSTAEWNIGLTIDAITIGHDYYFLDVDFRCMSQNWTRVVNSTMHENRRLSLNATVNTIILPQSSFQAGLTTTLEFNMLVTLKFDGYYDLKGMCKNTRVGFPPGSMEGFMEGGRKSCHLITS
ncbi:hypothetical protein ACP275_10G120300 [Erythranthe tilingii]